jgi:ribosomal protein S18 acetylase RimI-like enzyme
MSELEFRPARQTDCSHLALLADMATRCLSSHVWSLAATAGQSAFEVGRSIIRNDAQHFSHFSNWRVAESCGDVVGAINTGLLPPPLALPLRPPQPMPEATRAPNELKAIATGTCYLSAAALYPEYQRRGFGAALIDEAMLQARHVGAGQLTLLVGSFNTQAHRLYLRCGFEEWARRPFTAFPGSDSPGEWVLMRKAIPA